MLTLEEALASFSLTDAFEEGVHSCYVNGTLSIETIIEVFRMGETEAAIVKVLSFANVGLAPDDCQMLRAMDALARMKDAGVLKSYDVRVRCDAGGPRIMAVSWSKMLKFPAQTFSVLVENLTRCNLEISEVMDS